MLDLTLFIWYKSAILLPLAPLYVVIMGCPSDGGVGSGKTSCLADCNRRQDNLLSRLYGRLLWGVSETASPNGPASLQACVSTLCALSAFLPLSSESFPSLHLYSYSWQLFAFCGAGKIGKKKWNILTDWRWNVDIRLLWGLSEIVSWNETAALWVWISPLCALSAFLPLSSSSSPSPHSLCSYSWQLFAFCGYGKVGRKDWIDPTDLVPWFSFRELFQN